MAKTGRTDIGFTSVPAHSPDIEWLPEKAAQTFAAGAVLVNTAGYLLAAADADPVSTGWGFAMEAGQDYASDGDGKCPAHRFRAGQEIEATLNGTAAIDDTTKLAKLVIASGVPTLTLDVSGKFRLQRLADGWSVGDANARYIAIPIDSFIAQGGGNE